MDLPALLKRVRKPNSAGDRSNATGINLIDSEMQWLLRFHEEIRNQFTHFAPMGWSIEVSGLPKIASLISRIIAEIAQSGWAFRHMSDVWHKDLSYGLAKLHFLPNL